MRANLIRQPEATAENVIPLTIKPKPSSQLQSRFAIKSFNNPRTGSTSWRVTGIKRDGARVRKNFTNQKAAQLLQVQLQNEYLTGHRETEAQVTTLSSRQLRLAESAFHRLGADDDLALAVDNWLSHGKALSVKVSPKLDDAFAQYAEWLGSGCKLRDLSKANLRRRVNVFINSVPNVRVVDITPETIRNFTNARAVSAASKDNDRRAVSSFLSWCMDDPRKWLAVNPCSAVTIAQDEKGKKPAILTLDQCRVLMQTAETFKGGRLAPFAAVCLFGGLRPYEAQRLRWEDVNLADGEIGLEGWQTKTGDPRTVAISPTLKAWLAAHKGKPFFPSNWRKDFNQIKAAIGFGTATEEKPNLKPWIEDVLRHSAISYFFRKTGSFGETADEFGNSESIIKKHYKSRVTSNDTKQFYAIKPAKKGKI